MRGVLVVDHFFGVQESGLACILIQGWYRVEESDPIQAFPGHLRSQEISIAVKYLAERIGLRGELGKRVSSGLQGSMSPCHKHLWWTNHPKWEAQSETTWWIWWGGCGFFLREPPTSSGDRDHCIAMGRTLVNGWWNVAPNLLAGGHIVAIILSDPDGFLHRAGSSKSYDS